MVGAIARLAGPWILAATLLFPGSAHPVAEAAPPRRPWYLPDHAKVQFAGNIGYLSPGIGYAPASDRLEADLFLGWVPESVGGRDIFSVTGKLTWLPWRLRLRGWSVHPVTAAVQLTHTFGEEFFLSEPEGYPRGYHVLPTALRAGVALGAAIAAPWAGERVRFYLELVALDVMLAYWIGNPRAIEADDVVSVALGLRAAF